MEGVVYMLNPPQRVDGRETMSKGKKKKGRQENKQDTLRRAKGAAFACCSHGCNSLAYD